MGSAELDGNGTRGFKDMAEASADEQERQAQKAQHLAWMDWLQEGPARGLRKQHQFTKVKGGWIESALIKAGQESSQELGFEDGVLGQEQTRVVLDGIFRSRMYSASDDIFGRVQIRRNRTGSQG